jgi:dienelactone hydrolase
MIACASRARDVTSLEIVHFPSAGLGRIPAGPELSGWIYRPQGDGPFPAIIFAHSCSGFTASVNRWGRLLADWGYLAIAPDSFGPRGKSSVCGVHGIVTPDMRVADIAGALDYLKTRPDVVQNRIGLIGLSHGGSTTLRALQAGHDLRKRGLRGGVAYYPGCSANRDRDIGLPLLVLIGDKDNWTRADWCRELQASGLKQPSLTEFVYYPNAHHSFDGSANRTITAGGKEYRIEYDPDAASDAERRTREFFDRLLRK